MPSNIQNVSFVNPLDPGGAAALAVQQQQIQRQQAIAQALQQQSFQEDRVDPGSRMSWTQGAAKLAEALAAKSIYKKTQDQQVDLATKQGQMMARMFGLGGAAQPEQPTFGAGTQGNAPGVLSLSGDQSEGGAPPQPSAAPGASQSQPQRAPTSYPMSLSGDPTRDYTDYSMNPEEYTKALISSHAPGDFAKLLQQSGIDPNSSIGRQLMRQQAVKQNYIAPVTGRPGAIQRDPITNKIIGVDPQNIEGANPEIVDGEFTGRYTAAPGAVGVVQGISAAKSVGGAAGEMVDVYDPTSHQMVKIPKSALLSGAAGGQAPMAAAPPLGATSAFNVSGSNSANAFQAISDGAADVPNRIYALNQMSGIVADPKTVLGPGSEQWNKVRGVLGTLTGTNAPSTTNAQEFGKWASQYSARSAQELGLSGSDARVQIAVHATPNGEMTKDALRSVIPQMVGIEHAKQGYATAAVAWQQAHGPDSVQAFRTEWNKVYNPGIYTHMVQGPQAFAGWVKSLDAKQAAQVRNQYLQLKQLGALPQ